MLIRLIFGFNNTLGAISPQFCGTKITQCATLFVARTAERLALPGVPAIRYSLGTITLIHPRFFLTFIRRILHIGPESCNVI